jgi:CO/xanthine dehydrogenase Mo-binding subunit
MRIDEAGASLIGKSPSRADAVEKAVGMTRFGDDVSLPGMLWGRALRSPVANARIRAVGCP